MYYSYVEIEYVASSFSPAKMDLAVKLLRILSQSGFPIGMIALTTLSRLSILDRANLNPLFRCAMMRGRVPRNNTRAREGGRRVVM